MRSLVCLFAHRSLGLCPEEFRVNEWVGFFKASVLFWVGRRHRGVYDLRWREFNRLDAVMEYRVVPLDVHVGVQVGMVLAGIVS